MKNCMNVKHEISKVHFQFLRLPRCIQGRVLPDTQQLFKFLGVCIQQHSIESLGYFFHKNGKYLQPHAQHITTCVRDTFYTN